MSAHGRVAASSNFNVLVRFRAELAELNFLRTRGSLACACTPLTPTISNCRAYASTTTTDHFKKPEHGLHWPPRPEALAANPVLAHALRSAARHARSELHERVNQALQRPAHHWISQNDLQSLQGDDVNDELQQCGMHMSDSRAQNLATLWQIIEDHQPSSPPKQLPSLAPRYAAEPASRATAQSDDMQAERMPYATIATPMEIANMLVAAKADDVCILDVSSQCSFTEHMVLATGRSHRHIQAAAAAVAYQMSLRCSEVAPGARPSVEGEDGSDWCVVDAGSIIVHVFSGEARGMYDLDGLWSTGHNYTKVDSGHDTLQSIGEAPKAASFCA